MKTVLAQMVGEDVARILSREYGGLVLLVPKTVTGWVLDLPANMGEKLVRTYGGDRLYVPKMDAAARAARDRKIIAAVDAGERVQDVARRYRLTERRIWTILGNPPPEVESERQQSLF